MGRAVSARAFDLLVPAWCGATMRSTATSLGATQLPRGWLPGVIPACRSTSPISGRCAKELGGDGDAAVDRHQQDAEIGIARVGIDGLSIAEERIPPRARFHADLRGAFSGGGSSSCSPASASCKGNRSDAAVAIRSSSHPRS